MSSERKYRRKIRRAARRYGVRPELLDAQIGQESGYQMGLKSPAGAQDIAQFMPGTAKQYGVTLGDGRASDDIDGAARLMRDMLKRYGGDERKALAAYNAGAGNVDKYGGVPPFAETQNYVKTILSKAGRGGGGPSLVRQGAQPTYETIPGVDKSQLRTALKQAYFSNHDPNALLQLKAGLDQAQDTPSRRVRVKGSTSASSPKRGKSRIAEFDGKPVLAKFLPELEWARAHGWKGTVTSGVRTKEQQLAAAKSFGLQHYGPAGPLGSNHVKGHRGAVDVSDPDGLEAVLRRYPGRRRLKRGMADDPVHFSPTGH